MKDRSLQLMVLAVAHRFSITITSDSSAVQSDALHMYMQMSRDIEWTFCGRSTKIQFPRQSGVCRLYCSHRLFKESNAAMTLPVLLTKHLPYSVLRERHSL